MSIYPIIHAFDILLWLIIAANVAYILGFAIMATLPKANNNFAASKQTISSFLVLIPAYREDSVILNTTHHILKQNYSEDCFKVVVISDAMSQDTNQELASLPITLLQPSFKKSSKAKALQYAMTEVEGNYDYVMILDADNIVASDFLSRLNTIVQPTRVIQCHRTAKNADNNIAVLDGISEEINNSLFRRGHSQLGLSAGLIGSGMCFDYNLFAKDVMQLSSAVEDRELEGLLARQGVHIHYADDIMVYDEKVSSSENFQRQRLRWMSGQVQTLMLMLPYLPKAILHGNVNYVDKTIQQALIPRSLLLLFTFPIAILLTLSFVLWGNCSIFNIQCSMIRWWGLFVAQCLAIFLAIPVSLRLRALRHALQFPRMAWLMAKNLLHLNLKSKEFLHTTHNTGMNAEKPETV